jgi:hypothetical protein
MYIVLLGNVEGKILWRRGCRWENNIKRGRRNRMCGLSSYGSGYEPIAGCSEQVLTTSCHRDSELLPQRMTVTCHTRLLNRKDGCVKLSDITWQLDTSLCSVHSTVHDQLDYRNVCTPWVPKTPPPPRDDHKARPMGLQFNGHVTHIKESSAVHCYRG